jgi:hypothetical protein
VSGKPIDSLPFGDARDVGRGHTPRRPEETVLYRVVSEQLETFVARQRRRERLVPRFVERELRSFLDCGILAHGFLRVHCDACGKDRLVAYSCKGRGFCPSCGGRRMADTAAHLIDRVFPEVPVRRRARDHCGIRNAQCGAVTFVQRFGGALNLNVHFHTLALDGVYIAREGRPIRFHPLPPPDDSEVARVTALVACRIDRLLERRGLGASADLEDADPLPGDEPLLAALYGASVQGRIATGRRAGQRVTRLGDRIDVEDLTVALGPRCAGVAGVSVHANVCVPARDRQRLERLCRYAARPPVATDRLSLLADGRVLYGLKHRWRDGTTHVLFEPLEFVEKLAALVPPPRFNLVRYSGVLAPAARLRARVVPEGPDPRAAVSSHPACPGRDGEQAPPLAGAPTSPGERKRPRPRNYSWAELMRRVFLVDVLACPECQGRMRILAAIHAPEAIRAILDCLGLPSRSPPVAVAAPERRMAHEYE